MFLDIEHLTKSFSGRTVVDDVSMGVERGELVCILGPSGCGKTTTLGMIGGFERPDAGSVRIDGENVTDLEPEERPTSTVFQSYALFPHMDVLQNVAYGLRFSGIRGEAARRKAMGYLEMVGIAELAHARIGRISGGQQQRVALARALAVEPQVCLLDEPFSNLDANLRVRMRSELKALQQKLGITMVFVTHDQEEALALADRMAIFDSGRLLQFDVPREVYRNPANEQVRAFLDLDNLVWSDEGTLLKRIEVPDSGKNRQMVANRPLSVPSDSSRT